VEPRNLLPLEETFDGLYGLEVVSVSDEEVRGRVAVRTELKQAAGLLHGGVFAAMAESLTSMATWLAVRDEDRVVMGMANATSFLRPVTEGSVSAVGRARHRGRTTWVWDVDFMDDGGRLCATTRMTIAVR
jgi:1,4-dihydroxy-2-naphthoyl-CoA hydrolase